MSMEANNTAMKLNDKTPEEEIIQDSKKSWRESVAEHLLNVDAAKKDKAAAKEAKKADKKAKKEAEKKEAGSKLSLKQKLVIGGAVLGGAASVAFGVLAHRSSEDDPELEEIEDEEEEEEESSEEEDSAENTEETTEE